jgi:hypothetical protein
LTTGTFFSAPTNDTQWRYWMKISEELGQCGRQFGSGSEFSALQWRLFPLWVSVEHASQFEINNVIQEPTAWIDADHSCTACLQGRGTYIVAVSNIPMVVQFCASFKDLDPKIYYTLCNASLARFMPYYSAITVAHDTFIVSA